MTEGGVIKEAFSESRRVPATGHALPPRVAVICAAHHGNAGMYSVDVAAVHFFEAKDCDFDLFVTQFTAGTVKHVLGKPLRHLSSIEDLKGYSHIVYWGDFLNNPHYGKWDYARLDQKLGFSVNSAQGYERWADLHTFRQGRPSGRVVSIGNNFQHDLSRNSSQFGPALSRMQNTFSAILPRDPFSLQNLARVFSYESLDRLQLGMDCAFLLPQVKQKKRDVFCYAFGRSGFAETEWLVTELERLSGLKAERLDNWLSLSDADAKDSFDEMRVQIATSRFTLTDIYHVSVNSMVQKTPVVGLGRKQVRQKGTLGDFKKRVLFEMTGQGDIYFEQDTANEAEFNRSVADALISIEFDFDMNNRFKLVSALKEKFRQDVDRAVFGS